MSSEKIPTIADYAYISDCHSSALISTSGSIDWCCVPRVDAASCFGRIISWENGGHYQISPKEEYTSEREYLGNTMILVTHFKTKQGEVKLYDFFTMRINGRSRPHAQILRVIEGVTGKVELQADIQPRFEYGTIKPWIRKYKISGYMALGGEHGLLFSGNANFILKGRNHLSADITISAGEKIYLSMLYRKPARLDYLQVEVPSIDELDSRFSETKLWWEAWINKGKFSGPSSHLITRSALILKSLTHAPTGAIAAAATTSLPESIGGERNWDYRFSWIRDSYLSVRSLAKLGYVKEADGFRRFIERSSQGNAEDLQTLFSVSGQHRLTEFTIPILTGYKNSLPVRLGNAAQTQLQLDMYGYLMNLAWNWELRGSAPDTDYWYFLQHIVEAAILHWQKPDCGIWEIRDEPRHFVYSKMMCWVAIDRGIRLAKALNFKVDIQQWQNVCDEIRHAIDTQGYDSERGVFIQAFGIKQMDASLLCLPMYGFIDYHDERMIRTTNLIWQELGEDDLLKRYADNTDGFNCIEGVFLPCSFWLVICLINQNRKDEANRVFKRAVKTCNSLGLFSEEYDVKTNEMLGNFPQAFTHLTFIEAALELDRVFASN